MDRREFVGWAAAFAVAAIVGAVGGITDGRESGGEEPPP